MVSRLDISGFFSPLAWVSCLHAGCERERASSGGIPQATKPTVDLKQRREQRSREGQ